MAAVDELRFPASRALLQIHMFCRPSLGCLLFGLLLAMRAVCLRLSQRHAALPPLTGQPLLFALLLLHLSSAHLAAG